VVSFILRQLYRSERAIGTQCIGGWVGSTRSLGAVEKREIISLPVIESRFLGPTRNRVAVLADAIPDTQVGLLSLDVPLSSTQAEILRGTLKRFCWLYYHPSMCLGELRNSTNNFSHDSQYPDRSSNPTPPECHFTTLHLQLHLEQKLKIVELYLHSPCVFIAW
jgi:hypothetical protein